MSAGASLDTCGCFETSDGVTGLSNRPGLSSLAYRIGTHSSFFRRMVAALPSQEVGAGAAATRPLDKLTARATDDAGIALIDAWAVVADVLTFYQERIANEGFLRTATERRSILELARTIGYELNPGVAASAFLSFTVEEAAGAPVSAIVSEGVKIQSIPAQGKRPQTFETVEEIEARAEWNALHPAATAPQRIKRGRTYAYLAGTDTQLLPGDVLLFVGDARRGGPGSERWDVRVVETAEVQADDDRTLVTWRVGLGHNKPTVSPADNPRVYVFRNRANLFGHNAPDFKAMPVSVKRAYDRAYLAVPEDGPEADELIEGHTQWPGFELTSGENPVIHLDGVQKKVLPDTWIALTRPGYTELYLVEEASPSARSDFTISSKTTRLELDAYEHLSWFGLRETLVYTESEELPLAEEPFYIDPDDEAGETEQGGVPEPLTLFGRFIELDRAVTDLRRDHTIIVTGPAPGASEESPLQTEVAVVTRVDDHGGRSTLVLAESLANEYDRARTVVLANVARSTHGETVLEVLGSGDGAQANQRFTLRKPPLTYVSAQTPTGAKSELEVRVDGVLWEEVPSLYGLAPGARRYVVRIDDDANATVVFGDGQSGARLPTGLENVGGTYRSGIGPDGSVDAGSLTLLQTRPYGIKSVTNPIRSSGAAAPEVLEDARTNAPLTVLTLDRIVSLQDFEDFARSFAGIGKARAETLWDGESRFVHITVAAADGTAVEPDGELARNLVGAIDLARDDVPEVVVETFRAVTFDVTARVLVDSAHEYEVVTESVRVAIEDKFSFDRRTFGQPVTRAEIIATIQDVVGVVAATIEDLHYTGGTPGGPAIERLTAEPAAVVAPASIGIRPTRVAPASVGGGLARVSPASIGGRLTRVEPASIGARLARVAPASTGGRQTLAAQLLLVNSAGITLERMAG